jgi:hypothetical protein
MAGLVGLRGQAVSDRLFDVSGTITAGTTPQLILPECRIRTSLIVQNISAVAMYLSIGAPPATCAISSNAVSSVTVGNAGFGYSIAPTVKFYGGALWNRNSYPTYTLTGTPDAPSPAHPASAHCVMSGSAPNMTIASIAIDDPGAGYAYPPFVFLVNHYLDPYGCSIPSATNGILLAANGGSYTSNGSICTTDQMALYCATTGSAFTCKFSSL